MIKTGENLRKSSLVARNHLMKSHTGIKQSSSEASAVMWLNGNQASESACVWGLGSLLGQTGSICIRVAG